MRSFLAVPDSFKGTLASTAVAAAIARGLEAGGASANRCPAADGGEGTMEVLLAARGGERIPARAHDPLGRPIETTFARLADGLTAVVEAAAASGLALVEPAEREPEAASTAGTGELIVAALEHGAGRVLVAAGGTATTDGGVGAIEAIAAGGGLRGAGLEVLCDVRAPFERAAALFGPQKGADRESVSRLTERLQEAARRLPRDPRRVPMTGCGGGLSGGLWAALDARLVPGAAFVLDQVGFGARVDAVDAVITGEGRLDAQTFAGKLIGEIAARSRSHGKPLHAIVGASELDAGAARAAGLASVREATTLEEIETAARDLARQAGD